MSVWTASTATALATSFAAAALGAGVMLAVARRFGLVDRPNERSAHRVATPTLGGVGIVAGVSLGLWLVEGLPPGVVRGAGAGLALLLLAVVDDVGQPLAVWKKVILQLLAIAAWLGLGPSGHPDVGPLGAALSAGWLLWIMNVYNFMDGIDGITATHTVGVSLAAASCLGFAGSPLMPLPLVTAAAAAGFLVLNAPPARIFMGDVGSLGLGFLVGVTALAGAGDGLPPWASLLMVGVYAIDTTHTLVRRALRGENVLRAHQQHLYQRLVQSGWSHLQVDGAVLAVTALLGGSAWALVSGRAAAGITLVGSAAVLLLAGVVWKERRHGG